MIGPVSHMQAQPQGGQAKLVLAHWSRTHKNHKAIRLLVVATL
jgi:hypothetical protein